MPGPYSLLSTESLELSKVQSIFAKAQRFKNEFNSEKRFLTVDEFAQIQDQKRPLSVAFVFFEPSTRTRMSFQMAAYRLGLQVVAMDSITTSSIKKGESLTDTVMNINAMGPDLFVVRCGENFDLAEFSEKIDVPVVNAGSGASAHPTQALLDCYTLWETENDLSKFRVLIVGDARFSRVASSNFRLLKRFGAEVAVCAPKALRPREEVFPYVKTFDSLEEGLKWSNVCMVLRMQLERHDAATLKLPSLADFHEVYGVTPERLKGFSKDGIIMHPGPINHGVELTTETLNDPRCVVLKQVENGVYTRAALLEDILNLTGQGESNG